MGKIHWNKPFPTDSARMCLKHRNWYKKGICGLCYLEDKERQRQNEITGGSNKPKVVIKKI